MPIMPANIGNSHSPDLALIEALGPNSEHCPNCPTQQGINAILPAGDWENAQKHAISLPYIMEAEKINYYSEKPVTRVVVTDIMYDMSKAKNEKKPPQNLNKLTVINRSHIPQNVAKTVEYTTTTTSGFSFATGIGLGTTVTLVDHKFGSGKGPTMEVKSELTTTIETTFSYGEDTITEFSDSLEVAMEISWTSKMSVNIIADKFSSNIPFVATMKKYFFDGTTAISKTEGIYKGVHINNVFVQYGENKQLDYEESDGKVDDDVNEGDEGEADVEICHDPRYDSKLFVLLNRT